MDNLSEVVDLAEKLECIKKVVRDNNRIYVEIDISIINCVYSLYEVISNSNVENVIREVGACEDFVVNEQHLSTICLYIGFFCRALLEDFSLKHKIGSCYYKFSSELGNFHAMYTFGSICIKREKYETAIKYYKLSVKCGHPFPERIYWQIGYCYAKKFNYSKAIKYYEKNLVSRCPSDLNILYYNIGVCYYNEKDYDNAIKYYKNSLENEGSSLQGLFSSIAHAFHQKEDYDAAIKYYELVNDHNDNNNNEQNIKYYQLADCYYKKCNYDEAIKYYEKALTSSKYYEKALTSSHPSNQNIYFFNIGSCFYHKKDYNNAIKYYKKSLEDGLYDIPGIFNSIALAYYRKEDYTTAIEYYEKDLQKRPEINKITYCNIGNAYFLQNNYQLSLKYFKMAYKSGNVSRVEEIGLVYDKMNNYKGLTKYFKKSVELLKTGLIVANNIYNGSGNIFLKNKNYDDLLVFYIIKKCDVEIINQLIKIDAKKIQISTIADVATYFNNSDFNSFLFTFIRNTTKSKIELLETHFYYSINSNGYDQAKEDFYKRWVDEPK